MKRTILSTTVRAILSLNPAVKATMDCVEMTGRLPVKQIAKKLSNTEEKDKPETPSDNA